ncbi:hypothetical protein HPB49_002722 [Dermacentor silvarum]|uniref:Uncharacterized protein n=1 Tax=Dermacentor silvarum TaxID=543639 RepID=A0ACB8DA43_DERSI|nr:hypothetical protein HPB49_002722 [Dermacentor silvarum]
MSVTMQMTVEGEDLPPEEFSPEFGWQSAVSKRMSAKVDSANRPGCGIWENRPNAGALFRTQDNGNKLKSKIIRASRMPPMPKEHAKIIIRPRGGLNIAKTGPTVIGKAIVEAAGLTSTQISSDGTLPIQGTFSLQRELPETLSIQRALLFQNQDQIPLQGSLRIPAPRQSKIAEIKRGSNRKPAMADKQPATPQPMEVAMAEENDTDNQPAAPQPIEVPMVETSDTERPAKKRAITNEPERASGRAKSEIREMLSALSDSIKEINEKFSLFQSNMASMEERTNKRISKIESFLENVVAPVLSSPRAWLHCATSLPDHEASCPRSYHASLLLTSRPAAPGPSAMTDSCLGGLKLEQPCLLLPWLPLTVAGPPSQTLTPDRGWSLRLPLLTWLPVIPACCCC